MSLVVSNGANEKKRTSLLYDDAVVLTGHKGAAFSVKFSPDGQQLASAGMDRSIRLWNLPTDPEDESPNYGIIEGHKGGITALNWFLSNKILSLSADATVSVWDTETGQRIKTCRGHELVVNDCSAKSGVYISVGDDGTLRVWDEREKYAVRKIETKYPLLACDLSSDGKTAYVAGIDPVIRAYNVATGQELWNCAGLTETVTGLSLSSDELMLLARTVDGSVSTINAKPNVPAGVSRRGQRYDGAVGGAQMLLSRARFSKDDVYICLASDDALAAMWSTASQRLVSRFTGHESATVDIDFHPSEKILASCGLDGDIVVRAY